MWKEAFIAFFKVISRELPRIPEEKHENANMLYAISQSVLLTQRSRRLYRLNIITWVPLFESNLIQYGDLLKRLLYASFDLLHALTAQSLPKFKYILVVSLAASYDAAVQEYVRSSRRRRRRGRFSASISRGTNPPPPPQHHQ